MWVGGQALRTNIELTKFVDICTLHKRVIPKAQTEVETVNDKVILVLIEIH